ncbi:MAG: Tol-Pal system subunit TolQ, partial [Sphingobium sp.]
MNAIMSADAATLSPVALFLQADWVVKFVMIGLLAASIWTWAIIIGFAARLRKTSRASEKFEREFWKAEDIDTLYKIHNSSDLPSAK